jgi:hypothetical protein
MASATPAVDPVRLAYVIRILSAIFQHVLKESKFTILFYSAEIHKGMSKKSIEPPRHDPPAGGHDTPPFQGGESIEL